MAETQGNDVIVIGGSAGAVEAVTQIVRALPRGLPAAVAVVVHHYERAPSVFGRILSRFNTLPPVTVEDEVPLEPGHIYVPPSDRHLVIEPGRLRVNRAAKENRARPAVDPLFRSAAKAYRHRVMGIILTGNLDDGTAGLMAIKRAGGITAVQDPDEAMFPAMPRSALDFVDPHYRVPLAEIPPLIVAAAEGRLSAKNQGRPGNGSPSQPGHLVPLTCPSCHGALQEIDDGKAISFACHTGHTFGVDSLLAGQDEDVETALWSAVRALQEKVFFLDRLAKRAEEHASTTMRDRHERERRRIEHHVATLRRLLETG
jgi:two-component system chemotaxis response regulator CheB